MTSTFKPKQSLQVENASCEEFSASRLYRAIRKGDALRVLATINKGENVHLSDHKNWTTFLHLVVIMSSPSTEDRFLPMVYVLSNAGIDVNKQDKRGRSALELAINKELKHLMVALIRVGVDLMDKDYKAVIQSMQSPTQPELLDMYDKYEPGLWGAVKKNNVGMAHMLVNSWCRISTVKNNHSLLQYAKLTRKSAEIIQVLEDFDSTLEFVHATLAGDERRMLQYLMDPRGTDPYIMDISYQESWSEPLMPRSLRDTAVAMGHTHILHLIPELQDDSSDNNSDYDIGINGHHLDDEDEHKLNNDQEYEELNSTNSEYSGSMTNSVECTTSFKPNLRSLSLEDSRTSTFRPNFKSFKSVDECRTPSANAAANYTAIQTRPSFDNNCYYYKSFEESEQEMYHPDHLIHMASLSAREYRMNWDHGEDSRYGHVPLPKLKKKKKKRKIKIKKPSGDDIENMKSKMCVIS